MKAIVLAGGLNSRGKPFTYYCPKLINPIFERPPIEYVVSYVRSFASIDEIFVVTNLTGQGSVYELG